MVNPNKGEPVSGPESLKNESVKLESVETEKLYTKSRNSTIIIHKVADGDYVAVNDSSTIARGESPSEICQGAVNSLDKGRISIKGLAVSDIEFSDSVALVGEGRSQTVVSLPYAANTDVFTDTTANSDNINGAAVKGLKIDGNKRNNDSGYGIYGAFFNSEFYDFSIRDTPSGALWLAGSSEATTDDNDVSRFRIINSGGRGITIGHNKSASPASGAAKISHGVIGNTNAFACFLRGNECHLNTLQMFGSDGIFIDRGSVNQFDNIGIQPGSDNRGIVIKAANGVDSVGNQFHNIRFKGDFSRGIQLIADGNDIINQIFTGISLSGTGESSKAIESYGTGSLTNVRFNDVSFEGGGYTKWDLHETMGVLINGRSPTASDAGAPTYKGNGSSSTRTETQSFRLGFTPSYVAVQNSDGDMYDVHASFGTGYHHNTPAGNLSVIQNGFEVEDGGHNADPNTEGEIYTVYYEV